MQTIQSILIRNHAIRMPLADQGTLPTHILATLMGNLSHYGYALSVRAFMALSTATEQAATEWWTELEPVLKAITGDDKEMDAFVVYKNFPQEVMDMTEGQYWFNQILMYWGLPNELFTAPVEERKALTEEMPLKALQPATDVTLPELFHSMLQMPQRWTEEQWRDIETLVSLQAEHAAGTAQDSTRATQLWNEANDLSQVGFKENMVRLAAHLLSIGRDASVDTATDVLRLAVGLSEGDISLRTNSKFRTFARKERKFLLGLLQQATHLEADVQRHPGTWKRLMRALRPGDYKQRFPRVVEAYDKLYRNDLPATFAGRVEAHMEARNPAVLRLLAQRPGEFVRRLHACLLRFEMAAVDAFVPVLDALKTIQLLKLQRYLETVNTRSFRTFAPKGNWNKLQIAPNAAERTLREEWTQPILQQIGTVLYTRLQEELPTVSLDARTAWVKLQTSDSELTPYGRGTRFPIPEQMTFIRTACYWKVDPTRGNTWFDNGWNFFGPDWEPKGACCWINVSYGEGKQAAVFSGDPTNSKEMEGRACQMIDLYLDELREAGVRYAVWNILCYSRITFADADEVYAALQWGEEPQAGNLFEPSRCQLSFPLEGNNYTKYIAYIDVETREVVYIDANLRGNTASAIQNTKQLSEVMPAFCEYVDALPSVFDLFKHHPNQEDGTPILYNDREQVFESETAYVFQPENQHNAFSPLDIPSLLNS